MEVFEVIMKGINTCFRHVSVHIGYVRVRDRYDKDVGSEMENSEMLRREEKRNAGNDGEVSVGLFFSSWYKRQIGQRFEREVEKSLR